jgi:large subunit ribosomal protein L25
MSETTILAVETRERAGKGTSRRLRHDGQVPAVIYGNKEPPQLLSVERRALDRLLHKPGFFSHILTLDLNGTQITVLPRDVQFHPVTDAPIHVDFLRLSKQATITVMVPCKFINHIESPGLKRGGVLNIVRHEIEMICAADAIPENVVVDLSGREVGDSIHVSHVSLPDNVKLTITDRNFTIASIAAPSGMKSEENEAATASAGS